MANERAQLLAGTNVKTRGSRGSLRFSYWVVLGSSLVSTVAFAWVYSVMAFEFRRRHLEAAFVAGFGLVALAALAYSYEAYSRLRKGYPGRALLILALLLWVAACGGLLFGDRTYAHYTSSYYSFQDLDTYINIDPDVDKGATYTDAGIVYFKEGTTVAAASGAAFRNGYLYCAAPIVRASETTAEGGSFVAPASGTVDFWAVGLDCCSPNGTNFHCGEVDSEKARSGVRFLQEDHRDFLLLAVQQWASGAGLPVRHPLFFSWVKDPLVETDSYLAQGKTAFWAAVLRFLLFACVAAVLFQLLFIKLKLP